MPASGMLLRSYLPFACLNKLSPIAFSTMLDKTVISELVTIILSNCFLKILTSFLLNIFVIY